MLLAIESIKALALLSSRKRSGRSRTNAINIDSRDALNYTPAVVEVSVIHQRGRSNCETCEIVIHTVKHRIEQSSLIARGAMRLLLQFRPLVVLARVEQILRAQGQKYSRHYSSLIPRNHLYIYIYLNLVVTGKSLYQVQQRLETQQRSSGSASFQDDPTFRNKHATLAVNKSASFQLKLDKIMNVSGSYKPQNVGVDGVVSSHADDFAADDF